jgi:small GTP-binding protein
MLSFASKVIKIGDKEVKLHLWDTAGQERHRAVTKSYYTNAVGAIIVYDITKYLYAYIRFDSFQHVMSWLEDARDGTVENSVVCIVGNKSDLKSMRLVASTEAAKFCQENSKMYFYIDLMFFECSDLDGENVQSVFDIVTKHVL